jgi:hypothetical protein
VALLGLALDLWGQPASPGRIAFGTQVRPLLSDRCFKCHGPDEKARKARFRLDVGADLVALRDAAKGTRAVVAGHPESSELWRRVTSTDPDDVMPPAGSGLTLSAAEKELLRRWIVEGAEHTAHWAFVPVGRSVPLPGVGGATGLNPVDGIVGGRLAREGLRPGPEATREALLRRVSLDLTGLPPGLEEQDAFLADSSPEAYAKVVDRLLGSPAYGERAAAEWLDLARYADTYGYQADVERDLSPWRDWVVRAFNANLPYDQFLVWQIAGDLLPGATRDQVLATAFNRLHRQTNEGGSIEEEFRAEYAADRVNTLGTAVLGLTLECARCHDHKYDPITQREYYRLFAFFNNIDESGLYSHFTRATPSPTLLLYPDGAEARHEALRGQIAEREGGLAGLAVAAGERFAAWRAAGADRVAVPEPVARYRFEAAEDGRTANAVSGGQPGELVDGPRLVEGHAGRALCFSAGVQGGRRV